MRKLSQRNFGPDLMRLLCILAMIYDHTLNMNGVMQQPVIGTKMFIWIMFKTLFFFAGPLLLMITGYLMKDREPNKRHYIKLIKTLTIYFVLMIPVMIIKHEYYNEAYTLTQILFETTSMNGNEYSWFLSMYVGLYVLIPYINIWYKSLKTKKEKQNLLLVLIIVTILPSFLNGFNFNDGAFLYSFDTMRTIGTTYIFPSYFIVFFPLTIYLIGTYISDYNVKIKNKKTIPIFIGLYLLFSIMNYLEMYGIVPYDIGSWNSSNTGGWQGIILAFLIFQIFININYNRINQKIKNFISFIGKHTLGTVTLSHSVQIILYYVIIQKENFDLSMNWYLISGLLVFIICNILVTPLYVIYDFVYKKIVNKHNLHYLDYQGK